MEETSTPVPLLNGQRGPLKIYSSGNYNSGDQ